MIVHNHKFIQLGAGIALRQIKPVGLYQFTESSFFEEWSTAPFKILGTTDHMVDAWPAIIAIRQVQRSAFEIANVGVAIIDVLTWHMFIHIILFTSNTLRDRGGEIANARAEARLYFYMQKL